jgi:hypothetical protein
MTERFGCQYTSSKRRMGRCFSDMSYLNLNKWHQRPAVNPWIKRSNFRDKVRKNEENWINDRSYLTNSTVYLNAKRKLDHVKRPWKIGEKRMMFYRFVWGDENSFRLGRSDKISVELAEPKSYYLRQ